MLLQVNDMLIVYTMLCKTTDMHAFIYVCRLRKYHVHPYVGRTQNKYSAIHEIAFQMHYIYSISMS